MSLLDIPGIQNFEQDGTTNFLIDVLDSAASGIIITDDAGTVQYANPRFLKIFRYGNLEQILGKNAAGLFVSDRVAEFDGVRCIVQPSGGQIGEAVVEYKDGTICPVEVSFSKAMDKQGRILGKMASFVDISKRKHAERKLRKSEEKLRSLSRKIIESQENERKRVAKELHDSVGGNLAAIKFALEEKLEHMCGSPPDESISLEKIVAYITDTITEVRRISNHLMPSMLEDIGVLATIRAFCREQGDYYPNTRIITRLIVDENNIPDLLKITIFRVIQESLNNAFRHAEPDTIEVSLAESGDCIELCVTDNGCGFAPENLASNPDLLSGFGLKGMRDRAEVCNGTCDISSEIGKGTQVKLFLPYRAPNPNPTNICG
jgi:PAS domain S-box-containing protein